MASIRILPPEVVNRIAAGEVVERPASVLKELVENAIDASATEILVDLEEGGTRLIFVRDNGSGIPPDEMPLAFESHATSKLNEEEMDGNLLGVSTLGFRGEALASIASVAMVEMVSKTHGAEHAHRYRPGNNPRGSVEPAAGETGTSIEVRNLFYNVPARRKFLRSASTELSHAVGQLTRLALGFPGLRFRLTHARKPVLDLPAADTLRERLRQLLGKEVVGGLLEVKHEASSSEFPSLEGFVGSPRLHRKDAQGQNFFVNGRWVRDRVLSHALRSAYQGFLIPGFQPIAYLFLDLPSGDVDVNVHPTKAEVRFRDSSDVYRLVHHAVREVLARPGSAGIDPAPTDSGLEDGDPRTGVEAAVLEFLASPSRPEREGRVFAAASPRWEGSTLAPQAAISASAPIGAAAARGGAQILQSYILLEAPDGITLIDQHAFHEKVLFEEIHRKLDAGEVESQRLLVPDVVELPQELMPLLDEASAALRSFGFEVEHFGPRTAAIHAFPALFDRGPGRTDLGSMLRAVLELLREDSGASRAVTPVEDRLYRIAATVACKRAVKAGTPLSRPEIEFLLARGDLATDPRHCPHGRPTKVFFSRRDIEREFDRK